MAWALVLAGWVHGWVHTLVMLGFTGWVLRGGDGGGEPGQNGMSRASRSSVGGTAGRLPIPGAVAGGAVEAPGVS